MIWEYLLLKGSDLIMASWKELRRRMDNPRRVRSQGMYTKFGGIEQKSKMLIFYTRSATDPKEFYIQLVRLKGIEDRKVLVGLAKNDPVLSKVLSGEIDLSKDSDLDKLQVGMDRKKILYNLMYGDIEIFCNCADWSYMGFKYIANKNGFGVAKEFRPPHIKNPAQVGTACKHMGNVFNVMLMNYLEIYNAMVKSGLFNIVLKNTKELKK